MNFIGLVSLALDAHEIAALTRSHKKIKSLREFDPKRLAEFCEKTSPFQGEIEIDEIPLRCPIQSLTDNSAAKMEAFVILELAKIAAHEKRMRGLAGK